MLIKKIIIIIFLLVSNLGCRDNAAYEPIIITEKTLPVTDSIFDKRKPLKDWHLMDVYSDSIPGISLNKAYGIPFKKREPVEVIVAILDSRIDTDHPDLNGYIWTNKNEIPNNHIDDDDNGYIDDDHGWNFLGSKDGKQANFTSYSYTRVLKVYRPYFQKREAKYTTAKDSILYQNYLRAEEAYSRQFAFAQEDIKYVEMVKRNKSASEEIINPYFKGNDYNIEDLDSLEKIFPNNKELNDAIVKKSNFIKYGFTDEYIENSKLQAQERVAKLLNLEFDDRALLADDPEDFTNRNYGNNQIHAHKPLSSHGTEVSSVIRSLKNKKIKIMPVVISAFGDEYDKDIALGIYYAVDNGAKVINMSFGKKFSLHSKWVIQELQYAEKKNVLIVKSAGNEGQNLNLHETRYPTDMYDGVTEISNNFLVVGSSSNFLNENIKSYFSNYGNKYVDVFAPGDDIYTALPNDKNNFNGGTSLACALTSGVAALLFSYFPDLSVSTVKKVIMDSGLEYDIKVKTPTEEDKNKRTPFNELSKSGKIINVYNALLMAREITKK